MASFGLGQNSSITSAATTAAAAAAASGQLSTSSLSPSSVVVVNVDASTPWMACAEGNLALLQHSLHVLNLNVSAQDEHGYALVHAAASYNQLEILQWLFATTTANANANTIGLAVDEEGDGILHYASTLAVVQFCVEKAHIPLSIQNLEGKTALQTKKDELEELLLQDDNSMQDDDDDDDDEEVETLKAIIQYLEERASTLSLGATKEGCMHE